MARASLDRVRPFAAVTAALTLMIISLGVGGGLAVADPGHGNSTAATHSASPSSKKSSAGSAKHASAGTGASSHASSGTAGTSGDPSKPQPNSHADNNSGGANGQCPGGAYCSTRDGSPSMNGNGGGKATGKPCAGCVGKADNKNPKGQRPNGSDHNAGYECDRNHGIGRSNPAHTGCTTTPPEGCQPGDPYYPTCVPPEGCQPGDAYYPTCVPPEGCQPGDAYYPTCVPPKGTEGGRKPVVKGVEAFRTPPTVKAVPVAGALPNTGTSMGVELLGLLGVSLLGAGVVTMAVRRKRS